MITLPSKSLDIEPFLLLSNANFRHFKDFVRISLIVKFDHNVCVNIYPYDFTCSFFVYKDKVTYRSPSGYTMRLNRRSIKLYSVKFLDLFISLQKVAYKAEDIRGSMYSVWDGTLSRVRGLNEYSAVSYSDLTRLSSCLDADMELSRTKLLNLITYYNFIYQDV